MSDKAMGNLNYERRDQDFYATPEWCTEALIPHLMKPPFCLDRNRYVWEPACGKGAMSGVLKRHFEIVDSSDLHDYGYEGAMTGRDFFGWKRSCADAIITNPPYHCAEAFIRHALKISEDYGGVVAMLLRNEYDSAKSRNDLFSKPPFAKKIVLTSRPRWIEDSEGSPRHNYAWFVWSWAFAGEPIIGYGHKEANR